MSDIHALIRAFLQQQTIIPLPADGQPFAENDSYTKAGVVPFVRDEEGFRFFIMKPRSTAPELGIPPLQICKGTRMHHVPGAGWCDMRQGMKAADMETLAETALREGIEELGLKLENIGKLYEMGGFGFASATTGKPKQMWLFAASMLDEDDFLHDREVAMTTEARQWISAREFATSGREDHRPTLSNIETRLAQHLKE